MKPSDRKLSDVLVVGAGAFGAWTALSLRERGLDVTLVDTWGTGNVRSSSGGESRNIRASYGEQEIYARWAVQARKLWEVRQEEFGRRLLFTNGSLRLIKPERLARQLPVFKKLNIAYEMIDAREARSRWPQLLFQDSDGPIFYEPYSGIVKAQESLSSVVANFQKKGGNCRTGHVVSKTISGGRLTSVAINGETFSAGAYVFACGPWLPKVFPEILEGYIRAPRQELIFIGSPAGDERYRVEHTPNITEHDFFTSADLGNGYKIGSTSPGGAVVNIDMAERVPTRSLITDAESFVRRRLPGLIGQPVIATHVCQADLSNTGHYIIDVHPGLSNAWVAGGGSGHAFKMGPVLGETISDWVLGGSRDPEEASLFSIAAHDKVSDLGGSW